MVFSLSGEVDNEASVEDLDAINGRIHELDELTRRWVMSRLPHCLSEVCNGASLTRRLMLLADFWRLRIS